MLSKKEKLIIEKNLSESIRLIRNIQGPGIHLISEITEHIFLSKIETALVPENLKSFGITVIFHLGTKVNPGYREELEKRKITYINHEFIELDRNPGNLIPVLGKYYTDILNLVKSGKKTVIACETGVSLSAAVVLFYFMKRYYTTNHRKSGNIMINLIDPETSMVPELIRFLKDYRPCIEPDSSYIYQILLIESELKKKIQSSVLETAKKYFNSPEFLKKKELDPYLEPETGSDHELIRNYLTIIAKD